MQNPKAYNKILKARTSLVINHPFFASLALKLKVREDMSCQTAWTDGRVFAYNPHYVNMLPPDKLEGLAAHTVMHPACGHHRRRYGRDHDTWNRACDYAVNWILLDAGITLPDGFLDIGAYRGKSADAIYEILREASADQTDGDEQEKTPEAEAKTGNEDESAAPEAAGTSARSEHDEDENGTAAAGDPGKSGEVRDDPGGAPDTGIRTDWDEALVQAAINARGMGKLPAAIARLVHQKLYPRLDWRIILSRFIERSARSDYSWITPNRRYIFQNLYFPSLKNHELSEVVIAVDTSGSIHPGEMERFHAEISAILAQYPTKVHLIYCDAGIAAHHVFDRYGPPPGITPKGGGGTDFRPVFTHIEQTGMTPACLIYFTDMECLSFPEHVPPYPVLWIKAGDGRRCPPFGELLEIDINDITRHQND